jgi:hypothetical protein
VTSRFCSRLTRATGSPRPPGLFILDVVDQLDLAPFYRAHRADGHGHPAYDPKTLLGPMLDATAATLAVAGIHERPGTVLADSGYWSIANLTAIPDTPEVLIPPAKHGRQGEPRKDGKPSESRSDGLRAAMVAKLQSEHGKACYAKRGQTVEPVFGQVKDVRGARRFMRRGLGACTAEWKLLCGTHNLLKLWRHQAAALATPATT